MTSLLEACDPARSHLLNGLNDCSDASCAILWRNAMIFSAGQAIANGDILREQQLYEKMEVEFSNAINQYGNTFKDMLPNIPLESYRNKSILCRDSKGKKKEASIITGKNLWRKYKTITSIVRNNYYPLFKQLYPNGKFPSGKQLSDIVQEFSEKYFLLYKSSKNNNDSNLDEYITDVYVEDNSYTVINGISFYFILFFILLNLLITIFFLQEMNLNIIANV